ncbi:hypothetical protein ABZ960_42750 [Streptomyces pseudovenezuelae]|uniref:hypothetical protein n=1 Tax=Streptomyces pseudovenezuelae TaxID=67350 RepID=UPI0034A3BEE8
MINHVRNRIQQQQKDLNTPVSRKPADLTLSETATGKRLLKAARLPTANVDPPALPTYISKYLSESASEAEKQWDRYDRMHAQWEIEQQAAQALWESYWDKLDLLYAEYERAQEAAKSEEYKRKVAEFIISALRAQIKIMQRQRQRDQDIEEARRAEERERAQQEEARRAEEQDKTQVELPFAEVAPHKRAEQMRGTNGSNPDMATYPRGNAFTGHSAEAAELDSPESQTPEIPSEDATDTASPTPTVRAIREISTLAAGIIGVLSFHAMGPILLMSGLWAFRYGIPWGHGLDPAGKTLAVLLFVLACLVAACFLMVGPPFLADDTDLLPGGCLISLIGVTGGCFLLGNYPFIMEWLPRAVGAY